MTRKFCLILLLLFFCSYYTVGQNNFYRHQIIGTRDGLNSSKIFALHQDASRKLWIGTEHGISRYNGYDFINIQYSIHQQQIGRVLAISGDKQGALWVGGDKGLFYLNNNEVRQIEFSDKPGYVIETIITDATGNIWIGGYDGIYKIPVSQTASFIDTSNQKISNKNKINFSSRVFCLSADRYENIYAATSEGIFMLKKNAATLNEFWKNPDPENYVRSVAALSPDSVFWNLYDSHPMQLINGKLSTLTDSRYVGRNVFTHNNAAYALTTSGIDKISPAHNEPLIWYDGITNLVYASIIDAEGNIWLGSWEGLIKYRKTAFNIYQLEHPLNKDAFSFLENDKKEILIGGNRGRIFYLNNNTFIPHTGFPQLFERAEVMSIYQADDKSYWFGSGYQGISRFKNNTLRNWNGRTDELQNNNCEAIINAGNGKLFACTEKGVTLINPQVENSIIEYYPFKNNYAIYPELFGGIQTAAKDWFFYGSQGIYRLHNKQLHNDSISELPFAAIYINKIVTDRKGFFWIATLGHGLLKCSYSDNKWKLEKQYNKASGLMSDNILSVVTDLNDNIWLGDYMSLTMIKNNEEAATIVHYNENDGLLNSYYQTLKLFKQKNGTIWGTTTMGVFSFHPDSINNNTLAPVLKIDSVIISSASDNARISLRNDQDLKTNSFKYYQNSIQFNFTAISLTNPDAIRYAFRIPQLDSNWTITENRFVNFRFLQPGNYIFELKASNNHDVWTSHIIKYEFKIVPPFWKTKWFIVLMLLAIALIVYALFRRRLNAVRQKAAFKQQLAELEGKALRAQMNPHFIFNSLNAIQECIVSGKVDTAYDYLSRFSKLLRMVLNNSEKNLISLQQEVDMLKIYLELEALRFKNNFSYEINIEENVEPEMCMIPPLLLQPYIENAIWHGLLHKEADKKLNIDCIEKNGKLFCIITDNGIGRSKSAEIKAAKLGADNFESKGMKLSEERINIMNMQQSKAFSVHIEDLYTEESQPAGTKVIIELHQTENNS